MRKKSIVLITIISIVTGTCICTYGQEAGSVTDARDGTVYKTVKIGDQEWMGENLAYKTPDGWSVYENISGYVKKYGYLYSWEAATKACPDGWHLPSMQDWWTLSKSLGGDEIAGGKLKQAGTSSWKDPNTGATNSSGFTALPSGRSGDKSMEFIGTSTFFWTNVDDDDATSWCGALESSRGNLTLYPVEKKNGFSVRCIKNSGKAEQVYDFW
ncbi:MAG: FISUMP domain-containing protein [Chloroflexota bacterium]